MALAIMISTFGCANGLILAGARVYYAMARDGLFFRSIGRLNANHVPAMGLVLQGIWAAILVLLRTRLVDSAATGAVSLRKSLRRLAGLRDLRGADVLCADHWRAFGFASQTP